MSLEPEHQKRLDKIAEDIFTFAKELWVIKSLFDSEFTKYFKEKTNVFSPFLNFRDALFHYQKMYNAAFDNKEEILIEQYACIEDHLNRGLKDFAVYICFNYFIKILRQMIYSRALILKKDVQRELRHIYHVYKNIVDHMRLDGQSINQQSNTDWLDEIVRATGELYSLLRSNKSIKKLYERCAKKVAGEMIKKVRV